MRRLDAGRVKLLLLLAGLAGVAWEAAGVPEPRLPLLGLYALMMGLITPDVLERFIPGGHHDDRDRRPPSSDPEENRK